MDKERKMVIKRRYTGIKALIIVVLFCIELYVIFMDYFSNNHRALFALAAYGILTFSFIGKMSSSKIYLKYEYLLGVMLKSVVINIITFFEMIALLPGVSLRDILLKISVLLMVNLLSVVGVFVAMNIFMKIKFNATSKILHIHAEEFKRTDKSQENAIEEAMKKIDDCEYVYLHNVPTRVRKRLLKYCYEKNKVVYCTANLSDVILRTAGLTQDVDKPIYYCTSFGIGGISAIIKRMFDIIFSIIMIVITAPVMIVTAMCIKLEDGGSSLYKQVRCTKDMKEFTIFKFRSMRENSEGETAKLAVSDDDRLTKVGRVIRRFKIDELPQFFNILKGDMSVVGPRPERPEMIKKAIVNTPEFILRTKVKAGLTGYAQIRGYYNTGFKDKLLWDLIYIETFSLILDVKIILMTVIAVFSENIRDD